MASRGLRITSFFFHLKACERRNFDFCVFLRVGSLPGGRVLPGVSHALRPFTLYKPVFNGQTTHPLKHTKIKVSPLTSLQMEKNYVFRNPRDAI